MPLWMGWVLSIQCNTSQNVNQHDLEIGGTMINCFYTDSNNGVYVTMYRWFSLQPKLWEIYGVVALTYDKTNQKFILSILTDQSGFSVDADK
jgi:hypothetical protein